MGKITYNYDFLKEWMERNRLLIKDVAIAIGTTSYQSINRWADSKKPMNIEALLKLVNAFDDLLLEDFFMIDGRPMIERLGDGRTVRSVKALHKADEPSKDDDKDELIESLKGQIKSQNETILTQKMLIEELRGKRYPYATGDSLMVSESDGDY